MRTDESWRPCQCRDPSTERPANPAAVTPRLSPMPRLRWKVPFWLDGWRWQDGERHGADDGARVRVVTSRQTGLVAELDAVRPWRVIGVLQREPALLLRATGRGLRRRPGSVPVLALRR